ncbi:hypothetical protein GCM10027570_12970 [Streptomonospora sediminis]
MRSDDHAARPASAFRPGLLLIPVLSTAFSAVSGVAIDASLPLAGFGLVWGIAVMLAAPRLAGLGDRSAGWAQAPLYLACALAFMSLGGGILGELLWTDPQRTFEVLRAPGFGLYFASIHGVFEWLLLPAALILNWRDRARRYLLLAAAVFFYALRMVSAVYFAPVAMEWAQLPAGTVVSGELQAGIELWTSLNLLRRLFQEWLVTALLVIATLRPRSRARARA